MSFLRTLSASLLAGLTSFTLLTASGCGTKAVGVDDCRDIEQARCRAGKPCGLVDDVAACERYYRDHCLHGLAIEPSPGASVSSCVEVIRAAGECAKADPEAPLEACESDVLTPSRAFATVCDVVRNPERAPECAFLTDTPPVEEGEGGQGGTAADEPADSGGTAGVPGEAGTGGNPE
jgi:hypothetical protein